MKQKLYLLVITAVNLYTGVKAQTNKNLSNLSSPTAINQNLLPDINNSKDLGSAVLGWKNIYLTNYLYLDKKITLHSTGSGNLFAGTNAGNISLTGSFNTAAGQYSLGSLTSGIENTASGYSALNKTTTGRDNVAGGYTSLYMNTSGSYNTANGAWTLYNNTSGNHNVAYGYSALWQNQTGNDNTAIGKYAMYSNTRGSSNVALGTMALFRSVRNTNTIAIGDSVLYNFTGDLFSNESYTTAVGSKVLFNNISGYENTAIGTRAMYNTTKGSINTAIGVSAMFNNTEGVFNTAIGVTALSGNITGDHNTAIGYSTLQINKTGNQNTAIGSYAGPNSYDLVSNSTSIGYLARATASNQVWLGNTSVTSIGGQVGWTTFSDGRYKRNIKENVRGLAFINSLRPVTYNVDTKNLSAYLNKGISLANGKKAYNSNIISDDATEEAGKIIYDGFVAQEVEEAATKLGFNFSGVDKPKSKDGLYGLRYDNFVVPLVKAVQELSKQNDSLNLKIKQLENSKIENDELQKRIERLEAIINASSINTSHINSKNISMSDATLEQNAPNPFTNITSIHYSLSQKFSSAQINIIDKTGKTIKQVKIAGVGKGFINIDASALSSGTYNYSLVVDGKIISSKQMVLTK